MTTYQDIEPKILAMSEKMTKLSFMTRDEIFEFIAMIVALSDELNRFVRDLDLKVAETEKEAFEMACSQKLSASLTSQAVKQSTSTIKADKDWANKQIGLLSEMRIAALAAQRGAE